MSDRDNFTGGLIAGAVVGGLVGGAIGFLLGSAGSQEVSSDENESLPESKLRKIIKRQLKGEEEKIETARRTLEDKIAQLNEAIDEVRFQLGDDLQNQAELDTLERSPTTDTRTTA